MMQESTLARIMTEEKRTVMKGKLESRCDDLMFALEKCCPPLSRSDRTCYLRLTIWVHKSCLSKILDPKFDFPRIIKLGIEASGPTINNPMAVLISSLKREYKYMG